MFVHHVTENTLLALQYLHQRQNGPFGVKTNKKEGNQRGKNDFFDPLH